MRLPSLVSAVVLFVLSLPSLARACSWNEPWHETIVKRASSFLVVKVLNVAAPEPLVTEEGGFDVTCGRPPKKVRLSVLEHLAGEPVPDVLEFDVGFRGEEFDEGQRLYMFLARREDGRYALGTPIGCCAVVADGKVTASYRHSLHQGVFDAELYEASQRAIFRSLHGETYDVDRVRKLIRTYLGRAPDDVPEDPHDERNLFFRQHVALETLYLTRGAGLSPEEALKLIEPFLEFEGYHVQISAVRALSGIDSPASRARLVAFLRGEGAGFAKVMAIWGLDRLDAREQLPALVEYAPTAETDPVGFGGSIMDPRAATRFPASVKAALEELLTEWRSRTAD